MLEVLAHLNPIFVPDFHLLVLDVPDEYQTVALTDLPIDWQGESADESLPSYLSNWLNQPDQLTVSVPSPS